MPEPIEPRLACPSCTSPLVKGNDTFTCGSGHRFPIVDGVPRFVSSEHYARSFGYEWHRHAKTQLDSASGSDRSGAAFRAKTALTRSELDGALVLDVGIGTGRFAEVAMAAGARIVGVDLSRAAEVAAANLGEQAWVAQADLFHLPFEEGQFDVVYSIGVLHHTPDTRSAINAIARQVRPGGILAIWVYAPSIRTKVSDVYRRVTTRLPATMLYRLCALAARLDPVFRIPVVGLVFRTLLPISGERDRAWRTLDTFDWYAPRYQWKHTYPEVFGWFEELGLVDIRILPVPTSVRARRPDSPR
jgi:SAM-dependent methyltransferase